MRTKRRQVIIVRHVAYPNSERAHKIYKLVRRYPGWTHERIAAKIRRDYPDAKTTAATVSNILGAARKAGLSFPRRA